MKKILIIFLWLICVTYVYSQEGYRNDGGSYDLTGTLPIYPQIITGGGTGGATFASKNSATSSNLTNIDFLNYGVDVSPYSGTGIINIPIANMELGSVNIPIALNYDASGVRVKQVASNVGLNWMLISGPTLNRVIRGQDDFVTFPVTYPASGPFIEQCTDGQNRCDRYSPYLYSTTPEDELSASSCPSPNTGYSLCFYYDWFRYGSNCPYTSCSNSINQRVSGIFATDNMKDVYVANLPTGQIKFVQTGSNTFKLLNGTGYVINSYVPNSASGSKTITSFSITDKEGYTYAFGPIVASGTTGYENYLEKQTTISKRNCQPDANGYAGTNCGQTKTETVITGWKIRKITSPSYQEINFDYNYQDVFQVDDNTTYVSWSHDGDGHTSNSVIASTTTSYFISKVTSPLGTIDFVCSNTRDDFSTASKLDQINVKNYLSEMVKTFNFNYGYNPYNGVYQNDVIWKRNNLRLRLNSVSQVDLENTASNIVYSFGYDDTYTLPARNSYIEDHWGYCNALSSNHKAFFPPTIINKNTQEVVRLGSNKEPNANYMSSSILTSITTPTKGKIVIQYEPHLYASLIRNADKMAGGLRVKKIYNRDSQGNDVDVRNYSYLSAEGKSSGVLLEDRMYVQYANAKCFSTASTCTLGSAQSPYQSINDVCIGYLASPTNLLYSLPHSSGAVVGYDRVILTNTLNGSTEYTFHNFPMFRSYHYLIYNNTNTCWKPFEYSLADNLIPYYGIKEITKYYTKNVLKNVHASSSDIVNTVSKGMSSETFTLNGQSVTDPIFYAHYIKNGSPKMMSIYKQDGSIVSKKEYTYSTKKDLSSDPKLVSYIADLLPIDANAYYQSFGGIPVDPMLMIAIYKVFTPVVSFFMTKNTEYLYPQTGTVPLVKFTAYKYDSPKHDFPTCAYGQIDQEKVKGTINLYPQDYLYGTGSLTAEATAVKALVDKNDIEKPIEVVSFSCKQTEINDFSKFTLLGSTVFTFNLKTVGLNSVVVSSTENSIALGRLPFSNYTFSNQTIAGSNPFGTSITTFSNYSNNYSASLKKSFYDVTDNFGRPIETHLQNDISKTTLWGYNGQYPVASINGASIGQVGYTSFEDSPSEDWQYGTPVIDASLSLSGNSYYNSVGLPTISSTKSFAPLSGVNLYKVSFYAKSAVASSIIIKIGTIQQTVSIPTSTWQYYYVYINPVTSAQLQLVPNGTTIHIDELRIHPKDSKMVTTCYKPMLGIISEQDENSLPTYYEFDGYGRLKRIRNQDKNIIKLYNYTFRN